MDWLWIVWGFRAFIGFCGGGFGNARYEIKSSEVELEKDQFLRFMIMAGVHLVI